MVVFFGVCWFFWVLFFLCVWVFLWFCFVLSSTALLEWYLCRSSGLTQTSTHGGCAAKVKSTCVCHFQDTGILGTDFRCIQNFFFCFCFSLYVSLNLNQYKHRDKNHATTSECLSCTKPFRGII